MIVEALMASQQSQAEPNLNLSLPRAPIPGMPGTNPHEQSWRAPPSKPELGKLNWNLRGAQMQLDPSSSMRLDIRPLGGNRSISANYRKVLN